LAKYSSIRLPSPVALDWSVSLTYNLSDTSVSFFLLQHLLEQDLLTLNAVCVCSSVMLESNLPHDLEFQK